jgi:iron complex outermembrane recepter protein
MSAPSHVRFRMLNRERCAHAAWLVSSITCISFSPFVGAQTRDRAASDSSSNIAEVIVTAQKRQEQLQDVPISLSVLNGKELDAATLESVNDIISQTPGIYSYENAQNGGTKFSIRGVTSNASLFSGSSTVAYYLDEVPFAFVRFPVTPDANAYDMQRVEVLRGPQGTLYGASALNGVIRILTQDANLSDVEFKTRASTSNTEGGDWNYRGDLAVNVPIVEGKLAARAVVGYQDFSGWIEQPATGKSDVNDNRVKVGRLKINAKPTDNLSVKLEGWINREDRGARSAADDNAIINSVGPEPITSDYDVYAGTIDLDLSSVSLTSATSYIDYDNVGVLNAPVLIVTTLGSKLFAQELRLSSTYQGPWQWSLGGMYRDAEDRAISALPVVWGATTGDRVYRSESYAAFGELRRAFADGRFEVSAGLRYFEDRTKADELSRNPTASQVLPLTHRKETFDAVTPRAVLSWHPSSDLHVYASYSEGFRSGYQLDGTVLTLAPNAPPVKEDRLANYEIGAKGSLFGGRLAYDAAAYYINWTDTQQQLFVTVPGTGGAVTALPLNGEDISGPGFDLSLNAELTSHLTVALTGSWNDLGFEGDVVHPNGTLLFLKGERPDESPETTVGASLDYEMPFGTGYEVHFSAGSSYTSKTTAHSLGARAIGEGDSFTNVQLRMSLLSPTKWTATIFADNVANEDPRIRASPPAAPGAFVAYSRVRPRTVGLQFEYRY